MEKKMGKAMAHVERRDQTFDLEGLFPRLDGDELTLEVPIIEFRSPIWTDAAMQTLTDAGITQHEIDEAFEEMMMGFEAKLLGRMLAERRRRM